MNQTKPKVFVSVSTKPNTSLTHGDITLSLLSLHIGDFLVRLKKTTGCLLWIGSNTDPLVQPNQAFFLTAILPVYCVSSEFDY